MVAAVAALLLAACGGGSAKATATTPTSTTTPGGRRFQSTAFTTCLKQHGVTLPPGFGGGRLNGGSGARGPRGGTGGFGGRRAGGGFFGGGSGLSIPGVSADKVQTAFTACRSKLPNGGGFGGGANRAALQAYLSCLGDHGVTVPKPSTSTPTSQPRGFASPLAAVRRDPKFTAANKICRALLPTPGGSTTTTTTP